MVGGMCLGLVVCVVGDDVVFFVMFFVQENVMKFDWRCWEVVIYVFGFILEGFFLDKLIFFVYVVFFFML